MTSRQVQVVCAWISALSIVGLFVGFFVVSGYVPPRPASDSPEQIADFYRSHTGHIRAGLFIMFTSWVGYAPLTALLGLHMARVEGRRPVLALLQMIGGVVGWVFLLLPEVLLMVAAFRPDRAADLTQSLHDMGWICAFVMIPPFEVQCISLGVCILSDRRAVPIFPRWTGYFTLWCALLFLPGDLLIFFKSGPLSYQGIFVFWIPMISFGVWIFTMSLVARYVVLNDTPATAAPNREAVTA